METKLKNINENNKNIFFEETWFKKLLYQMTFLYNSSSKNSWKIKNLYSTSWLLIFVISVVNYKTKQNNYGCNLSEIAAAMLPMLIKMIV